MIRFDRDEDLVGVERGEKRIQGKQKSTNRKEDQKKKKGMKSKKIIMILKKRKRKGKERKKGYGMNIVVEIILRRRHSRGFVQELALDREDSSFRY